MIMQPAPLWAPGGAARVREGSAAQKKEACAFNRPGGPASRPFGSDRRVPSRCWQVRGRGVGGYQAAPGKGCPRPGGGTGRGGTVSVRSPDPGRGPQLSLQAELPEHRRLHGGRRLQPGSDRDQRDRAGPDRGAGLTRSTSPASRSLSTRSAFNRVGRDGLDRTGCTRGGTSLRLTGHRLASAVM
jgi:hypothetical protein